MTKAEMEENQRLVRFGCYVCRVFHGVHTQPEIHHVRRITTSMKRDRAPKIPLCYEHHRGSDGIHNGRRSWEARYGEEIAIAERMAQHGTPARKG